MRNVTKAQLRSWLQDLKSGTIEFQTYLERLGEDPPRLQIQLRAAMEQSKVAGWAPDEYQPVREVLDDEFGLEFTPKTPGSVPTFSPFAAKVQRAPMPDGWEYDENGTPRLIDPTKSSMTGKVESAEGATKQSKPTVGKVRKNGRFLPHVAELWFIGEMGTLQRLVFEGDNWLRRAFLRARKVQSYWTSAGIGHPMVLVKYRRGERVTITSREVGGGICEPCEPEIHEDGMKGNRHVLLCDANGMLVSPEAIVQWHAAAKKAGIRQKLGERFNREPDKVTLARLAAFHERVEFEEPENMREIVYSLQYGSGTRMSIAAEPLSDVKDKAGKVTLAGHRKRAMRILLDSPCPGADVPYTVKYTVEDENGKGTPYVVSRKEALLWAEPEDDELMALAERYEAGELETDEYIRFRSQRLDHLDPAPPRRRGPTMHQTKTRVEYGSDGRHVWGRAKNSSSIGSQWVGTTSGVSFYEAQALSYQE